MLLGLGAGMKFDAGLPRPSTQSAHSGRSDRETL